MILFLILDILGKGGTERSLINTCNSLSKCGYTISILSIYPLKRDPFYKIDPNISVQSLSMCFSKKTLYGLIKWNLSLIYRLRKYVLLNQPTHIFSVNHTISIVLPFIKSVNSKYACEHIDYKSISIYSRILMNFSYCFLTGIIVLSETAKRKMFHLNKNIIIIPNSLSFSPKKREVFDQNTFLVVGRINQVKGLERLLSIAVILKEKLPSWRIKLFGEGNEIYVKNIKTLILDYDLEDYVKIYPPVSDIKKEYINSSIYLMTSHNEAYPMVLLEAMSCGLPVVAFECEGTKEIVQHGKTGYLIKNNDFHGFVNAIISLVFDKNKLIQMSEKAFTSVNLYKPNSIVNLWKKVVDVKKENTSNK